MEYKYQIIFLGTTDNYIKRIRSLLFEKIRELKLLENAFKVITEENYFAEYKGNQPGYVLYFGDKNGSFKNVDLLQQLLLDGTIILPIYSDSFTNEIPELLSNQNGLKYSVNEDEKIVSLVLESFGKLRATRKVFISYKRNESSSVALQLYEELERKNFDVFLDTHSIKQGEPFQEELWHRMSDCDVVVLLNTPNFLESRWCKEEIAEASAKLIGVVQLVWPKHKPERFAEISFPVQMEIENFDYWDEDKTYLSRLKDDFIDDLVCIVESVRARNLASRQDSLITDFLNVGRKFGRNLNLQPERFITEEISSDKINIYIPSVGIPQSMDCHLSEELTKASSNYAKACVHLIYDDLRIRNRWLNHLHWLNDQLRIKTIGKKEFELCLKV